MPQYRWSLLFLALIFCCCCPCFVYSEGESVRLIAPEEIDVNDTEVWFSELGLEVEIRNGKSSGLSIGIYRREGKRYVGPFDNLEIRDEAGKELRTFHYVSSPMPPDKRVILGKGRKLRAKAHFWNGFTKINKSGFYFLTLKCSFRNQSGEVIRLESPPVKMWIELGSKIGEKA